MSAHEQRIELDPLLSPEEMCRDAGISMPFLDTYRTMCIAPQPEFQRLLQSIERLAIAA